MPDPELRTGLQAGFCVAIVIDETLADYLNGFDLFWCGPYGHARYEVDKCAEGRR